MFCLTLRNAAGSEIKLLVWGMCSLNTCSDVKGYRAATFRLDLMCIAAADISPNNRDTAL